MVRVRVSGWGRVNVRGRGRERGRVNVIGSLGFRRRVPGLGLVVRI